VEAGARRARDRARDSSHTQHRSTARALALVLCAALTVTHASGCGFVLFRNVSGVEGPSQSQARQLLALTDSSTSPVRVWIHRPNPYAVDSRMPTSVALALEGLGAVVSEHPEPPTLDARSVVLILDKDPHFAEMFASMPLFAVTLSLFPFFQAATIRVTAFELSPTDSVASSLPDPTQLDTANRELRKALRGDDAEQAKELLDGAIVTHSATAERRLSGSASMFPTPWMSSTGERAGPTGGEIFDEYEPRVAEALAIEALVAVLRR
jgi:hypothetical protein